MINFMVCKHWQIIGQATYVPRNLKARSCNYCCSGKVITITYSDCVFVALYSQHAMP
jgi:hypothetical protein